MYNNNIWYFTEDNWDPCNTDQLKSNYTAHIAHQQHNVGHKVRFENATDTTHDNKTVHRNNRNAATELIVRTAIAAPPSNANKHNCVDAESNNNLTTTLTQDIPQSTKPPIIVINKNQNDAKDCQHHNDNSNVTNNGQHHNNDTDDELIDCDPCNNKACNATCQDTYSYGYVVGHKAGSLSAYANGHEDSCAYAATLVSNNNDNGTENISNNNPHDNYEW